MKITDEQIARHPFLAVFRAYGKSEVTREEYLNTAWAGNPPDPLGAELESMLPPQLQDWNDNEGEQ